MLFHERKNFQSYKKVAVIVHDAEYNCDRVTAYHPSLESAIECEPRVAYYSKQPYQLYVRHESEPAPICGDYQI